MAVVCTRGTYGGGLPCSLLVGVVTNVEAVHDKPPRTAAGPPRTAMVILLSPRRERLLRLLPHTGVGKPRLSRVSHLLDSVQIRRFGADLLCAATEEGC